MRASAQKHEDRARSSYALYQKLLNDGINDWATTTLFYSALHLVQAFFVEVALTGFDIPTNHTERVNKVGIQLTPIYRSYRFLQTASENARCLPEIPVLTQAEIQKLHDDYFEIVVRELRPKGITLGP